MASQAASEDVKTGRNRSNHLLILSFYVEETKTPPHPPRPNDRCSAAFIQYLLSAYCMQRDSRG